MRTLSKRLHDLYAQLIYTGELVRQDGQPTRRLIDERTIYNTTTLLAESQAVIRTLVECLDEHRIPMPWPTHDWEPVYEMDDDEV